MPITWDEKYDGLGSDTSLLGQGKGYDVPYVGDGDGTQAEAEAALLAVADATYNGLPMEGYRVEYRGGGTWEGTVRYKALTAGFQPTGGSTASFTTTGGTKHITHSKATRGKYSAAGKTAPDFKGAIGVTRNGGIAGADIVWPQYQAAETHYMAAVDVDDTYKGILFALTGHTNNASFKGLNQDEGLFLGAQGQQRAQGDWEIVFSWAGSPNISGVTVGGISGIDAKGWDYVWVLTEESTDAGGYPSYTTLGVYVERVYDQADFSLLGIGV